TGARAEHGENVPADHGRGPESRPRGLGRRGEDAGGRREGGGSARGAGERGNVGLLLDVREKEKVPQGYIPKALSIPRGFLEMQVEEKVPDKSTPIVAYCAGGTRSMLAGRLLTGAGI